MPILKISIQIPPFNQIMNSKYIALGLDLYNAPFLEKMALSINMFNNQNEYKLYFCELKKFLALSYLYEYEQCAMVNKKIDSLWHQFILFTREYHHFCSTFFGKFIHHSPNLEEDNNGTGHIKEKENAENFFRLYYMTFGAPNNLWFSDDF